VTAFPRFLRSRWFLGGAGVLAIAAVVFGLTAILVNVFEHKEEGRDPFFRVVQLTDDIDDPAVWGRNFPLQYNSYMHTSVMEPTKYGGSQAAAHAPTETDPRTMTSQSLVEAFPELKTIWAGYAFATDFREDRGHYYMLEDQTYTQRQQVVKQPGTCANCHASTYTLYKKLGEGDITKGFEKLNAMPYAEARQQLSHPVACIDCHDPESMALRITRPAFIEGMRVFKAAQGVDNYDVNTMASRQEMRSFVCGQCHDEYYFKGDTKQLTYPWSQGLKADQILAYYDSIGFKDWTHAQTGAATLKAQHPEFELSSEGIHARSGVSCADCHMPYRREGAQKVSDHQVRSPLLDLSNACQSCHKISEAELHERVLTIQDTTVKTRDSATDALLALIGDLKAARDAGRSDDELAAARDFQRKAQFLLDFVSAENSTGFHAPQEAMRLLAESIDLSRKGQLSLRDGGQ
jgi:nitrite reductase (cytochrome c-552)